LRKMLKIR